MILNDGTIWIVSMGRFLSKEELEARPELLEEAQGYFLEELETLGIKPLAVAPPTPPPEEPSLGELYLKYYAEALTRHRAEATTEEIRTVSRVEEAVVQGLLAFYEETMERDLKRARVRASRRLEEEEGVA